MVGDVWEQIAEGSSSFMGLLVLAEQLGRTTVLPYMNNPPSENTASLFAGWRTETNTPFDSVFSIAAYKKCFPKNKLLLADDAWDRLQPKTDEDGKILNGSLGGGTLAIYWEYNVERQTGKKSITGIKDCTSKKFSQDRFWQTYTELFKQMHVDRALCISNDPMERFTVEELLSNNQGYNRLSRWLLDDCIISELIPGGHRAVAAAWENTKWNETENKKNNRHLTPG